MAKKARQAYQYEAPVTPSKWTGEEQRFSIRVKAVLEDLYQKFSSLSGKDASIGGKTWEERLLDIYPVGSIYMSVSSTSPASLFGGTWERIEARFLLGAGAPYGNSDNYFGPMSGVQWYAVAGSTGGQDFHLLTVDEMPNHAHRQMLIASTKNDQPGDSNATGYSSNIRWALNMVVSESTENTVSTGLGLHHNNMPPYLVVYMWKRVE